MTMSRAEAYQESLALWARLEATPTPNEDEVRLPPKFYEDTAAALIAGLARGAMTDVLIVMTRIAEAAGHLRFRDPTSPSYLLNEPVPGAGITAREEVALRECAVVADRYLRGYRLAAG